MAWYRRVPWCPRNLVLVLRMAMSSVSTTVTRVCGRFEDMHEPMIACYAACRACPNLVLVAGSGMGEVAHDYGYLSGQWSVKMGYPSMPFAL